ncbi:MAG: hypothetical protein JWL59_23 [Chthoniobacteraceae bacterium]|nr:hypothetical protein [Chthoniobacteraceae bacterium]
MGVVKSHQLFRELFLHTNPKELAAALGLSTSMIYKWAEPTGEGGSGSSNPLDRIAQLLEITGDRRIAEWICDRAGGFYIKSPEVTGISYSSSVVSSTNYIVQEFAQMLGAIATAALDNSITEAETRDIRKRWQELKSATEEFVCCCEKGNFTAIQQTAQ